MKTFTKIRSTPNEFCQARMARARMTRWRWKAFILQMELWSLSQHCQLCTAVQRVTTDLRRAAKKSWRTSCSALPSEVRRTCVTSQCRE